MTSSRSAGHGLDGIAEDRLHVSDFYEHARSQSPQQGDSINVNKVNQIESIHQRNENNRTERLGLLCPVVSILVIFMMKVFWRRKIVELEFRYAAVTLQPGDLIIVPPAAFSKPNRLISSANHAGCLAAS